MSTIARIAIPIQNARKPGSMRDPNVLIEMNAHISTIEAEIVNGVLTLYSFLEKRKIAVRNNTKLLIIPTNSTYTNVSKNAKPSS